VSAIFVWPRMATDVASWCCCCQWCARGNIHKHIQAPVETIATPTRRFAHIHVDLVGLLPAYKESHTYLFTVVDRTTRWPEAVLLKSTTAAACADALLWGWVSRFGVPEDITSDRGLQFSSEVWAALCQRLGIKHHMTKAYHPQANDLVERFHRQLKEAL
jgi:IS30 family transposase